jgi:uncharacterized protein DUF6166
MDTPQCGKGWADRCANSRGKSCSCRCGGRNHGRARGAAPIGGEPRSSKLTDVRIFSRPLERMFTRSPEAVADIVLTREEPMHPGGLGEARVNIPHRLVVHSPTGFEWGYAGSGPAELALNILARFTTPQDAYVLHQEFKEEFISRMPKEGGVIKAAVVAQWLADSFKEAPRDHWNVRQSRAVSA